MLPWYKKRQQSKIDKMSDRMATRHAICALSDAGRSNKQQGDCPDPQNDQFICFYEEEDKEDEAANIRPEQCFLELGAVASTGETSSPPIWFPEGFRLGAKFGSLRV